MRTFITWAMMVVVRVFELERGRMDVSCDTQEDPHT